MSSTTPSISKHDLFANKALAQIPKILMLQDRNPHSPTYGCFDRNYWHYKIIDFSSCVSQENVWPLALAYSADISGNFFFKEPILRDLVDAGIMYAIKNSHSDTSCDEYFPFERSSGAAAFSLLGCLESYFLMGFDNPVMLDFFKRRANYLAGYLESGRLANHQAIIVLCLALISRLLNTRRWDTEIHERLKLILSWQSHEGWFPEYEGFDPGYETLTISFLARVYEMYPSEQLKNSLVKAVTLISNFVHPDGSFGGEYGSRNTYNFFPHGFELVGKWMPEALSINDRFLEGLGRGMEACYSDDHILGHHTVNYFLAWKDFITNRPPASIEVPRRIWLREAGVLIDQRKNTKLYLALNKGGTFKFFRNGKLVISDTQFSLVVEHDRKRKNAVGHLIDEYNVKVEGDEISIQGNLGWSKQKQMTPINFLILRIGMLTIGRFFPDRVRKLLQNLLITGKKSAPFQFHRVIKWNNEKLIINDELMAKSWKHVKNAGIGGSQTSVYVVMSSTFQRGQLQPWMDLTDKVKTLHPGESLIVERVL